ncbi:hydroxyectoine utilization dehydratase EutB [Acidihalobacter ferrooxydans]|uniref:Hydroxyectoine utilization dehydratase EutB n=1 Tax=Acidihalobacter ferrooxydans TaxID=1765967 RepID=A0A1P8UG19_9GAMM|nr:hydroxyectoine utilization dehydratase EutB [Acidihalobacter ferrooxydans]APZ42776.1 hydroxyectoine utilization dehydratase EutB [Acidihalobacter ferrooxydans]
MAAEPPTALDVYRARARLRGRVAHTPLLPAPRLAQLSGAEQVLLKLETLQPSGSFKLRGATNALLCLDADALQRGVVTASTGNHGRAVAWAARAAGVACTVCLSSLVPEHKAQAVRDRGAAVVRAGSDQNAAVTEALRLASEHGLGYIPPFDHPDVIAGQGTLGLELLEDATELDTLLIPLSGGGLLAGVALAAKTINPALHIVGVSPERGAAMIASLAAKHPVDVPEEPTLADSLGGGIGLDNRYTFALAQQLLDDVVQVSEAEIARAMRDLYCHERLVTEGAAAVGAAVLARGGVPGGGRRVATIITGNNVDMEHFTRIVNGESVE